MAGDLYTASGAKLFIGPSVTSATNTAALFAALTWTEVGLVESLGDFGDESSSVTGAALGDGRIRKSKGARDAGTMAIVCFDDGSDVGQQAMVAAEATKSNFAFKIVIPNRLNATGTDEIDYFRGLVMSKRRTIGNNDNLVRRNFNLGVNSPVIEVPPTAGS